MYVMAQIKSIRVKGMTTHISADKLPDHRPVLYWLYLCCFMVFAMAVIGAITRLTESGLSIVEWKPVMGAIPPLTDAEWQRNFDLYRATPEFKYQHSWMVLADFKKIFFWEWFHRLWGRMIGLAFALPLAWLWVRKQIPQGFKGRFLGLLALGGLQGGIGYWMVVSGFADRTDVSHYRLATHLSMALLIYALLLWNALDLRRRMISIQPHATTSGNRTIKLWAWCCLALLSTTIVWGAFVAGLNAGLIYNTFPLMDKSFTPPEKFYISSIIEEQGWVQFFHRWVAILTGLLTIGLAVRVRNIYLGGMVLIQIALGVSTLLTQVNLQLAAMHQAGAIILLTLLLTECHRQTKDSKVKPTS